MTSEVGGAETETGPGSHGPPGEGVDYDGPLRSSGGCAHDAMSRRIGR